MADSRKPYIAHVEDADDDDGSSVGGIPSTRKYAYSEAPVSPVKERPNTGKSRSEKRPVPRRSPSSSGSQSLTDSDSTARSDPKQRDSRRIPIKDHEREMREERAEREREHRRRQRAQKMEEEEERKLRAAARAQKEARGLRKQQQQQQQQQQQRPNPLRHAQTQPEIQQHTYRRGHVEDPSCYGVQQPAAPASRPRAQTRPATYYGGQSSHPPITGMGWHQARQPGPPPFPVGTFPPPMFTPSPGSHVGPAPSPGGSSGYFDSVMGPQYHSNLKQRFDNRPSSAMGFQPGPRGFHHEEYDDDPARLARRASRSKKSDDRKKMPPPAFIPKRPQSAVPQLSPFAPPPPPSGAQRPPSRQGHSRPPVSRRAVGFTEIGYDDDDFDEDDGLFHDLSPEPIHDQRRKALSRVRHASGSFDPSDFDMSPSVHRGRRISGYGTSGGAPLGILGSSYEDSQLGEAMRYQEDVGGAPLALTAEALRKATKRGGVPSSRSTRSSESRDDSEYKRSNTTGITRVSSDNNEDVIIKVSGAALVRVQGAEIECSDGEIMFSSRPAGMRSGSGSDMASTVFQIEDSRSRVERKALPHASMPYRPRSDSQSRYAPSHAPYDPSLADNYF